jgi:hypothetical protein
MCAARPSSSPSVASAPGSGSRVRAGEAADGAPAALTMTTVHLALWETRLGTLARRNSSRSLMLALPTTTMSARSSSATRTIASHGSES